MEKKQKPISSSDSSFSYFASSFRASTAAAAVPPAAGTALLATGAPPPAPTPDDVCFTSFPQSAFARSYAQIGSISTSAASLNAIIFSAVISMPSSARIRVA